MVTRTVDLPAPCTVLYRHVPTGLLFIGEGPFLDVHPAEQWFKQDVVIEENIKGGIIQGGVSVITTYCDHDQEFFPCGEEKDVLLLKDLIRDHYNPLLKISTERLQELLEAETQAALGNYPTQIDHI